MSDHAPVDDLRKDPAGKVTNLLLKRVDGDPSALERLTPIIYDELLRFGANFVWGKRGCDATCRALRYEDLRWHSTAGL
jgi:hypothetical protein